MEAHGCRIKYLLYGLLIVGPWLLSCHPHYQFVHISFFRYAYPSSSRRPTMLAGSVVSPPPAVADDPSCDCEGRRVYMLDLPSRFNLLGGCLEGSPEFDDQHGACTVMSNAGLGPELVPLSGNHTDGVIPNGGW